MRILKKDYSFFMKKIFTTVILICICVFTYSQNTVTGIFKGYANQTIQLIGYKGFDTYIIDSEQVNQSGEFTLSFSKEDYGMGYLLSEDEKSFVVILAENENLQLKGENFILLENIVIENGLQNQLFEQY